jgi:hypothetical protein
MNRRAFVRTFTIGLLATPLAAEGQQAAGKVPLIGFLDYGTPDARLTWWKACGSGPLPPSGASSASAAAK